MAVAKNAFTTKIRPAFDAYARRKNYPSLNECNSLNRALLNVQIPAIITRFHVSKVSFKSDIKQAFFLISVWKGDKILNSFRLTLKIVITISKRFFDIVVLSWAYVQSIFSTLKHHLKNVSPFFKNNALLLHDSLYLDKCLANFNTTEE